MAFSMFLTIKKVTSGHKNKSPTASRTMKSLRFILILFSTILISVPTNCQTNDEALLNVFKLAKQDFQAFGASEDCNHKETEKTLKFLTLTNEVLKTPSLTHAETGYEVDCALRKTDLNKLRAFMLSQGYLQNPGSLHLINAQDAHIKLPCGKKGLWRVVGMGKKKDNDFNKDRYDTEEINIVAPPGYRYLTQFFCYTDQCSHTFYVVTRPKPLNNFKKEGQATEGNPHKITCKVSDCTAGTKHCQIDGKVPDVNKQDPYSMEWRVPPTILKEADKIPAEGYKCQDEKEDKWDKTENAKGYSPIYITLIGKNGIDKKNITTLKKDKAQVSGTNQIHIEIKEATEDHRGFYECVIIDKNGVPSTPSHGQHSFMNTHKRYAGKGKLHIRSTTMTVIPAVIILVILIVMAIIWVAFRKSDRMENEDGSPYPKDETVSPQNTTEESNEKEKEVEIKPSKASSKAPSKA